MCFLQNGGLFGVQALVFELENSDFGDAEKHQYR